MDRQEKKQKDSSENGSENGSNEESDNEEKVSLSVLHIIDFWSIWGRKMWADVNLEINVAIILIVKKKTFLGVKLSELIDAFFATILYKNIENK